MIRWLAALILAVATLAAPAGAQAPAELDLARPEPIHSLPFELYDGRIYLPVSVAGSGPRTFLLDTGAQVTHLSAELVRDTGLERVGQVSITGTGRARVEGDYVRLSEVDLGGLMLPVQGAIAAPAEALFGPVVASSGKRFDGVIGYDLFATYVVEIDYIGRTLRLYDPARYLEPAAADLVPISIVDNKPYLVGAVTLGGHVVEAPFHLDTGSGGAIGFNGDFVAGRDLLALAGATLPSMSRGVGGAMPARLGRADALTLGKTRLTGPFATYALGQGKGVSQHSAGRIGGAILRRFTLTINYPAKTIALVPNANFHLPLETDMSGLALISREGVVEVSRVEANSAGAQAGILVGDRLISIDGRAASELSLEAIRAMLMQHGATRFLVVLRQGAAFSLPITLRRRI